jgi:hypothetical protein
MNTYPKGVGSLVAAAIVCLLLTGMTNPNKNILNNKQLDAKAKQIVSERYNVPLNVLVVGTRGQHLYPTHALMVHAYKIFNKINGKIYGITLDQTGTEVNSDELLAAEFELQGRIDPQLSKMLSTAASDQQFEIMIWLKETGLRKQPERPPADAQLSQEELDAYLTEVDAANIIENSATTQVVVDKLAQEGIQGTEADPYAPIVTARLSANAIYEVSTWPEVEMVYLATMAKPALEVVRATTHAKTVQRYGINGYGVKVAVIEVGGRIKAANPYLTGVIKDTVHVCPWAVDHTTAMVGIIKSGHSTRRGMAHGATVRVGGSCLAQPFEIHNRSNAAKEWGARVFNLSIEVERDLLTGGPYDRFYDRYVMIDGRTVVTAAGNPENGNVQSPGSAYNVITVGNFDDKNTVGWADDGMGPRSGYKDPISEAGDREKPEVAAPGTNINSTTNQPPWTGPVGSGTSASSAVVSGIVALMMQRDSNLQFWPEAVKAILLATAVNNIEGSARLSEKDGAGGVDALRADRVAAKNPAYGGWGGTAESCAANFSVTIPLVAGRPTRVAIAWDQNPDYTYYGSKPSADLDLLIIDPTGAPVIISQSIDNTYEIVRFTPSITGDYRLEANKFRCDLTPSWLGWAYYHE